MVELLCQRLLRLRVDVPEDRIAVCLVSHDDAPLPAPIVALSDHPVSGWPPFSHMQDSFLSCLFSNNYHAGDTIATSRVESYQKVIISVLFVYGGTDFESPYQLIDMVLLACSCSWSSALCPAAMRIRRSLARRLRSIWMPLFCGAGALD